MITRFNSAGNERVKGVRRALTRQHLSERCQGEPGLDIGCMLHV